MKAIPVANAKKEYVELKLGSRTYKLSMTLNAIIEIQNEFGDLTSAFEESKDLTQILKIFRILVNEAIDNHNDDYSADPKEHWERVDERYIGRKINTFNLSSLHGILTAVYTGSLPENRDAEDDDSVVSDEMKELLDEIPDTDDEKNSDSGQS